MRTLSVLIFIIALSGCDSPNVKAAKDAVNQKLKDPGSAQYRNVERFPSHVVCGEVNAKNGMGGYVGFSRFVYIGSSTVRNVDLEPSERKIALWCNASPDRDNAIKSACQSEEDTLTLIELSCPINMWPKKPPEKAWQTR